MTWFAPGALLSKKQSMPRLPDAETRRHQGAPLRPFSRVRKTDAAGSRPRRGIYLLPNAFTTAALFGGFYAIVMAMNQRFDHAAGPCSSRWCWTAWTAAWRA